MKTIISIFLLALLSGCAHGPYSQEMLPDGKTWQVDAHRLECEVKECRDKMRAAITQRGKLLCGSQPFRVITCDIRTNRYVGAKAQCLLRCGEAPASAKPEPDAFEL